MDDRVDEGLRRTGEAFVAAVAARDFPGLRGVLAEDVRFRLLVPKGAQAQAGVDETLGRFEGWYAGSDEVLVESATVATVADRLVLAYRLRLRDGDGWRLIEQHLVAHAGTDGRLDALDLLCTGFHAVAS
jgi:hypothetical protein